VHYDSALADALHDRSVGKRNKLTSREAEQVDRTCSAGYERALTLRTIRAA
jgi:hypothetical protein